MGEGIYTKGMGKTSARQGIRSSTPPSEPRGTARIAAKQNINGGLTKAQEVASKIWEDKHREYKTERAVAIDDNGREVARASKGNKLMKEPRKPMTVISTIL